jgi:ABC-type glycerol-3-phosphate transport system substrate-binding protein
MKKFINLLLLILISALIISPLNACKKDGESTSGTEKTTSVADKTTSGTASKSASSTSVSKTTQQATAEKSAPTIQSDAATDSNTADARQSGDEGVNEESVGDSSSNAEGEQNDQSDANNGNLTEAIEMIDLKGRTLNLAVSSTRFTREFFSSGYNNEYDMFGKRLDYVEQAYNCKIELVNLMSNARAQEALLTNAVAGTYWADIMMVVGNWVMKCHNLLQPLDDFIDFNADNVKLNPATEAMVFGGTHYAVAMQNKVNFDTYMIYNKDIFGREGLPDLLELQREGRWTWEALLQIATTATRDLNGDGITDQWGVTIDYSAEGVAPKMVIANGGSIIAEENGSYRLALGDPKSVKTLQFLRDLHNVYKVGILDKNTNEYKLGRSAMAYANMPQINTTKADYPQNTGYVLFPKGPDADSYIIWNHVVAGWSGAIPLVKVEEPEKVAKVLYSLYSIYDNTYPDYISEIDMNSMFTNLFSENDRETLLLEKSIVESVGAVPDVYSYLSSDLVGQFFSAADSLYKTILNKNMPASSVIDSYRDVVNDKITNLLEQYRR